MGAQQIEFDYDTKGNQFDNSFALWLRAFNKAGEVPQAEVDLIEKARQGEIYHKFGQLFLGTPTAFNKENKQRGHITAWVDATGV